MFTIKGIIIVILALVIGFFAGSEYKAYQLRSALEKALAPLTDQTQENKTAMQQIKDNHQKIIEKHVGDEVLLTTQKIKVNSVKEDTILNGSSFGTPAVAKKDSKFVIINMDVTNITKAEYTYADDIILVDDKEREFSPYDTIGNIDNYLSVRSLGPSVTENGVVVYEVPNDSVHYSLIIGKAGTDENYKLILK